MRNAWTYSPPQCRNGGSVRHLPRFERRALTPAEASALLVQLKGDRLEGVFVVALSAGLRRGEVLGLRMARRRPSRTGILGAPRRGAVYVTDSFRPTLWHVTASQVAAGSGVVDPISVSPEIQYTAGDFNLNGIVAFGGGRELVVVSSVTGQLFRITFDSHATNDRRITLVHAPALVGGDGMIMDRGRLVVVTGAPARLNFLALSRGHSKARLVDVRPDSTLRGPSTVARAEDRYLVVNADFGTSTQPFTVSGLARGDGS